LSGCATVPDLGARPQLRGAPAAERSFAAAATAEWPTERWWTRFGDPQLDRLIEEALAGAPDLAAAAARLRAAEAIALQAGAASAPRVDARASAQAVKQSYNNLIPEAFVPKGVNQSGEIALQIGLDLDLWGRNRAALAAATSQAQAARLEASEAALVLSTNVAAAYAELARLHAVRAVQQDAVTVRDRTARLVGDRVAAGLDTQAEARQAAAQLPAVRAELAATDEQIALTRNRIAALVGQGPDRGLTLEAPALVGRSAGLPANVTTDLIARRPDVAAAKARAEAAASRIKVARADFYPSVNLSALVGLQAFGLDRLFDSGSTFLNAGPAVSLPIFRGGELQGRYREARAGYDEAVALYDGAVVRAFRDVADAVTSQVALTTRLAEARLALGHSEAAYSVAQQRFEGGLSNFLDVLTAEDRVLQARRIVAELKARAFALDVALVRALGGGFSATSVTNQTNKEQTRG
jgi:NodT family efflux transporter outer membrane factor (OMF) lipoprotein